MAIGRTAPSSVGIGTVLNNLASGSAIQTDQVTSGTTQNIVDITARWTIDCSTFTANISTRIEVFVWGTNHATEYPGNDSGTNEVITGTAGSITIASTGLTSLRFLKLSSAVNSGATIRDEESIVKILGFIPRRWGLVIQNVTGAALAASGHAVDYVEVYYT